MTVTSIFPYALLEKLSVGLAIYCYWHSFEQSTDKKFVIRKMHTAYLVTVYGWDVTVEPNFDSPQTLATATIATSMQLIGNSKLQLHQPADSYSFLKSHFADRGWTVEEDIGPS